MHGGDLDFPDEHLLSCLDMTNTQSNCSFDIDDFLVQTQTCNDSLDLMGHTDYHGRTQACTHAHACSPSGPDKTHTHTCIHVHTQIMANNTDEIHPESEDTSESVDLKAKKRPSGNREAVRKYRERKKVKTASLEDEVVKLRAINQELMKRLKNQSLLEAEVCRLKCLLVDIRGRIEGEIGSFPYNKNPVRSGDVYQRLDNLDNNNNNNLSGNYVVNSCNVYQGLSDCELGDLQCPGNQKSCPNEVSDYGLGYVNNVSTRNTSNAGKRKRACAATAS